MPWSKKYKECTNCHSTEHKHNGHGLCVVCYFRKKNKEPKRKKQVQEAQKLWRKRNPTKVRNYNKKHSAAYYKRHKLKLMIKCTIRYYKKYHGDLWREAMKKRSKYGQYV